MKFMQPWLDELRGIRIALEDARTRSIEPRIIDSDGELIAIETRRDDRERRAFRLQKVSLVLTLVAISASAFAVWKQVDGARHEDQQARYSSISELSLEVDRLLAEHPEVAPCFRDPDNCSIDPRSAADLATPAGAQVSAIATYIVDFYQYLYDQLGNLGQMRNNGYFLPRDQDTSEDDEDWVTWSETIMAAFRYSDALCVVLETVPQAYSTKFVRAVAQADVCPELVAD